MAKRSRDQEQVGKPRHAAVIIYKGQSSMGPASVPVFGTSLDG